VSSTTTTEGNFRTGMNDVLAQVNANQEELALNVTNPQVVTILTSGSSYAIPSNALAIYIRASGGGGGGGRLMSESGEDGTYYTFASGSAGGNTTISNTALSLSITAKGGPGAKQTYSPHSTGDSGGSVQRGKGASGGATRNDITSTTNVGRLAQGTALSANLVSAYISNSSVGGQTLSYSIGAGGAGASGYTNQPAETGQPGYIELWVW
jgi:hypothetical protein